MTCCDHGYGRPSLRPRVPAPATYRSGTPRNQPPAVAREHAHLHGLATAIHEISGLEVEFFFLHERVEVGKLHGESGAALTGRAQCS